MSSTPVLRAVEQADADLALEPGDLLAQRRLGDVQSFGRSPEVQLLREHHERAQQPRVERHARSLLPRGNTNGRAHPGSLTVVAVRALVPLVTILFFAACGGDRPPLQIASDDTGAGTDAPRVAGPPDAGSRTGHGADLDAQFSQPARGPFEVPKTDRSPPLAMLRLEAGASQPIVHASPVRRPRRPTVTLVRPAFTATALIRDADGGTGRIRVSVVYATRCDDTDRQHAAFFPPGADPEHPGRPRRARPGAAHAPSAGPVPGRSARCSGRSSPRPPTPPGLKASATRSGSPTSLACSPPGVQRSIPQADEFTSGRP